MMLEMTIEGVCNENRTRGDWDDNGNPYLSAFSTHQAMKGLTIFFPGNREVKEQKHHIFSVQNCGHQAVSFLVTQDDKTSVLTVYAAQMAVFRSRGAIKALSSGLGSHIKFEISHADVE